MCGRVVGTAAVRIAFALMSRRVVWVALALVACRVGRAGAGGGSAFAWVRRGVVSTGAVRGAEALVGGSVFRVSAIRIALALVRRCVVGASAVRVV